MRYTVNVIANTGQTIMSTPDCSEAEAKKVAKADVKKYPNHQVFIQWFRLSDGQHGYLNPDGNHSITGDAW